MRVRRDSVQLLLLKLEVIGAGKRGSDYDPDVCGDLEWKPLKPSLSLCKKGPLRDM